MGDKCFHLNGILNDHHHLSMNGVSNDQRRGCHCTRGNCCAMSERTEEASAGTSTSMSAKQRVKEWVGAVQVTQSEKERIAARSAQNLSLVINCLAVFLRAVQMKPQNRIPGSVLKIPEIILESSG